MGELTEEAKAEIRRAIEIVRQDKQWAMLQAMHDKVTATPDPTPPNPPTGGPNPPPPTPPNADPNTPPVKRDAYWGELLS